MVVQLSSADSTMNLSPRQSIPPTGLDGLHDEAKKCTYRYDFDGAAQILQRAHKLEPTNDKILVDLG
ncbi:MAG: Sulfotransferase, partial [Pedosphaera sp.]|nr:Sulfotransferase [Pedosphaera sp.]